MINSRVYWEVRKLHYVYWGKTYTKYQVSHVLEQEGMKNHIYFKSYTSRYGAINFCRHQNQKHFEDTEIIVVEEEDN